MVTYYSSLMAHIQREPSFGSMMAPLLCISPQMFRLLIKDFKLNILLQKEAQVRNHHIQA